MIKKTLFVICLFSSLLFCTAGAATVDVGLGSYLTSIPAGVGSPPALIYKTANITGPMQTNDWWSSLAWGQYSETHFAHPLAMCAQGGGLRVSYPGPSMDVYATGYITPFQNEFVLGHSNIGGFPDARVDGFSDWFVDVLFAQGSDTMRVSYGHGSPFIYATYQNGGAKITFDSTVTIWSGDSSTPTLGVTIQGRHYGLFGPTGSTWSGLDGQEFVNNNAGATHFSLAILPDNSPATLAFFQQYAYAHVVDTQVQWNYDPATANVETDYLFQTVAYEGSETDTIFALYPHQWKNTNTALLSYTYDSIRGSMKVGAGNTFSTQMTFHGVLPSMPDAGNYDPAVLAQYLDQAEIDVVENPSDTYWCGKSLGTLSDLIPISEQLGDTTAEAHFTNELSSRLETWFNVPADLQDVRYFAYDSNWGSLIGVNPSYGSNNMLNDHHFHYGYFVRAAAEIARKNKAWASQSQWGGMVELIIRDFACSDRNDTQFPFLRNFDPYAGHSWASGNAMNDLGNNQESSSEAMNAWTGLILWGQATGNQSIRDLGIYLYTTELNAINSYWFDVNEDIFPAGYAREAVGIIWGSKVDFLTYFGGNPQYIVGINLLPSQLYQGLYPDYVQRNLQGVADLRGGSYDWDEWQDIGWMYEALYDADSAMARFQAGASVLDSHTQTHAYHWIGNLQAMGQIKRQITSDYPTTTVFSKGDETTYVVSNITETPAIANFSDGTQITVQPGETIAAVRSLFPSVSITGPADGTVFPPDPDITITADASDTDVTITKVEFFEGANYLGEDTTEPYSYAWMSVPAGQYVLTAKATNSNNYSSVSTPVTIYTGTPELTTINVSPSTATIAEGTVIQFSASGFDQFDQPIAASVDWSIDGGGVIDENGYFVAIDAGGPYTVTATESGGVLSGTAIVDVSAGGLACDYDISGKVDLIDFADIAWYWQATDCDGGNNFCDGADHVGDGDVDFYDLEVLMVSWLRSLPPSVSITSPVNDAAFNPGDDMTIEAAVFVNIAGRSVTKVEFFEGANYLGEDTIEPYSYTWSSVPQGQYVLTAKVTDDTGQSSTSGQVSIVVGSTSLVINGGFETGDTAGWTVNELGAGSTIVISTESPLSGSYSAKFVTDWQGGTGVKAEIYQTVTGLSGSTSYDFELWAKGLMGVGGVAWAEIKWYNGTGGQIGGTGLIGVFQGLSNTTYQSRGGTYTTPAGTASANISIRLEGGAMAAVNTLYVDDVTFSAH